MADAILMAGGTGGVTSDDVTASKAQVLQGYKTVTTDSNDEVVEGTIPKRGTWSTASEVVNASGESTVHVRFEEGYYNKDGQYKPTAKIPYAVLSNVLGIDANKMLDSLTVAGVRGTIPIRGYRGPNCEHMFMYQPDGGYVVRIEPGYYHKDESGQWNPYVVVSPSLAKRATNYHPEKTLSDTRTCEEQGQIKMVDTKLNNYTNNQAKLFGMDPGRGKLVMQLGYGNAYYFRDDNNPHVEVDAAVLGTAEADSVLQWQTASSQHGIKFEGTIPRWIATHGDVILANPSHSGQGFAYDLPGVGRGIAIGIKNGSFVQGANYAFLPSPNFQPWNVRKNVNINGMIGTMEDYGTGRVAFRNATFDNVLVSGVANIGLGSSLLSYTRPATEIRDGIIRFSNGGSASGGGLHEYRKDRVLEESVTLAHSVNLTPFRTIRLGLKYPYGGKWGTVGGVGALVGVVWALPTGLPANYIPSINSKINASVIKKVGYKDGVVPITSGQWNTLVAIPNGAEYFVDVDVSELQGHHRIAVGIAVSSPNRQEATIQVNVVVNNSISGISHIEFIN
jgi:hypothetical protein|nr:MAG TPA: hypothetical protein [Caudoviricetes sp.]